jgi:hypothetical protein
MDVPGDMETGVFDGVCLASRLADETFFSSRASRLFFDISSLFRAYLSLSLFLFSSFGSAPRSLAEKKNI